MQTLPIDAHLPQIVSTLRSAGALALTAPPGSGKTTRIPRALFDAGFAENGEILVLEPRRLAARLAAARVAEEMGEEPGGIVGYSIRFENVSGPKTRIRFLTEAILTRRLSGDPTLSGVSVVILDEFHERHIETDIGLALARRAMKANPRLKLLVMSATLDAAPVAAYLGGAPVVSLSESAYELMFEYEEKPDNRPLHEKIRSGVLRLFRSGINGDILVFLPGAAEIRRAAEALRPLTESAGFTISLLHGNLPAAEQRSALCPADKPKVILSTNVAETSVTIPGIAAVIDSGLARVAGHSAWSGFPTLATAKISKSSATQRAGRAGRTQAGVVIRLYSRADYNARQQRDTPEILRADLAETALLLHGAGVCDLNEFDWFETPPRAALDSADDLLQQLGATDARGRLTVTGRRMLKFPAHPRLARLMLEGEKHVAKESCLMAALIAEKDIRLSSRVGMGEAQDGATRRYSGLSDPLELMDCFREAEAAGFDAGRLLRINLDPGAVQAARRTARQFERISGSSRRQVGRDQWAVVGRDAMPCVSNETEKEEALLMAILAAFPDRVAKRRATGERELLLAKGGTARLPPSSVVDEPMFLVAVDAVNIREKKDAEIFRPAQTARTVNIRLASAIEIEWLAEFFPEKLVETVELRWNATAGRVEEARRALYEAITLEETVRPAQPSEEAARILAEAIRARGIERLPGYDALETFRLRLNFVAEAFPEEDWPRIGDDEILKGIYDLCRERRSLAEVESVFLKDILMEKLTEKQRTRLDREAPERVALTAKRSVKVNYEAGRPPWIESRLQDFFGMKETPRICSGRIPVTLHLLAPNRRAVQVTQDLAGFWERHYPTIRRELMRRYPKHAWPDL